MSGGVRVDLLPTPTWQWVVERLCISSVFCLVVLCARGCWNGVKLNHRNALDDPLLWRAGGPERALLLPINVRGR
tara:strand:+ start:334 stop:558 length:225 start_codon:yes stop_codon:yes gene_type:complete